jgi:uncharacterized protein (TIGR03067 family)
MKNTLLFSMMLAVLGCSKRDDGGLVGVGVIPDINPAPAVGGDGEPAGPADEIDKLKGTWTGGVRLGDAPGGKVTVEITATTLTITHQTVVLSYPYKIDPTKSPKWIDLLSPANADPPKPTVPGIYELDGDKLTITTGYHGVRPGQGKKGIGHPANVYRLTRG